MKKSRKKSQSPQPSLRGAPVGLVAAFGASSADFANIEDSELIDREAPEGVFTGAPAVDSGLAISDSDLRDNEVEEPETGEIDFSNPLSLAKGWIASFTKLKAQQIAGIDDQATALREVELRNKLKATLEDLPC